MKSGFAGELLKETKKAGFNPITGLKRVIESRRQDNEYNRYGTPEERRVAYDLARESFAAFFENNPRKVGQKPNDPSVSQISFEWAGQGHGYIDRSGSTYKLHLTTNPYDFGDTVLGERFRRKHSLIVLNDEDATATEWVTTSVQPPIDRAIPFVSESKAKTVPLAAHEAEDLATIVHTDYIYPNFDSVPMDQDPKFQAWMRDRGL